MVQSIYFVFRFTMCNFIFLSNGSVIATSTVVFGTEQKSGQNVKNIFVTNYQHHPSPKLDLNINYTAGKNSPHIVSYKNLSFDCNSSQ